MLLSLFHLSLQSHFLLSVTDGQHVLVITGSALSGPDEFVSSGNDLANFIAELAPGEADLAAMAQASCAMLTMVHLVDTR